MTKSIARVIKSSLFYLQNCMTSCEGSEKIPVEIAI